MTRQNADGATDPTPASGSGSGELERSYRSILRLFPPSYRRGRESELLCVLLEDAEPAQRRPSRGERRALLVLASRCWLRCAVAPDRVTRRRVRALLAVVLPVLLLFPAVEVLAGSAQTLLESRSLAYYDPYGLEMAGWAAWAAVAVLVIWGRPSWPRWWAGLGTGAFLAALVVQWANYNYATATLNVMWLAVQLIGAFAVLEPAAVATGRRLIPRRWLVLVGLACGAAAGTLTAVNWYGANIVVGGRVAAAATGLAIALATVAMLLNRTGRAPVPVVAALAVLSTLPRLGSPQLLGQAAPLRWHNWGPYVPPGVETSMLQAGAYLLGWSALAFLAMRIITAGIDSISAHRQRRRAH